ncbi:tata-binding protein-associated factor [Anaeramoeba flamelloides]|uniref:Tata-binding protein-associated factor n=1 Tax=Anaeramoeba flamelloides TaxID=1746091 RepID=A0ABQ8XI09_9EUKA|nr:tata-binding protein-associated factor [Anaeramoeba flamelloides]
MNEIEGLLKLIKKGTSSRVRISASLQLGNLQKNQPNLFPYLLDHFTRLITSKDWDTRIAASEGIGEVLKHTLIESLNNHDLCFEEEVVLQNDNKLGFGKWDLERVLKNGTKFLLTTSLPFEIERYSSQKNLTMYFSDIRRSLNSFVGLGDLFDKKTKKEILHPRKRKINNLAIGKENKTQDKDPFKGLSKRQQLALRRKMKKKSKNHKRSKLPSSSSSVATDDPNTSNNSMTNQRHKIKKSNNTNNQVSNPNQNNTMKTIITEQSLNASKIILEAISNTQEKKPTKETQLKCILIFIEKLIVDLFHSNWEIRHGASLGLRQVFLSLNKVKQMVLGEKQTTNRINNFNPINEKFFEDIIIRILSMLCLDQFSDFVSDQAILPVRETCAQALAAVLRVSNCEKLIQNSIQALNEMMNHENWSIRYTGMISFKYLVVAKKDLIIKNWIPNVIKIVCRGLKDSDDDVKLISSEILLPILPYVVNNYQNNINEIINLLWDSLIDPDELSSFSVGVLELLSTLYVQYSTHISVTLRPELISRLFPLSTHTLFSVRKICFKTLTDFFNMYTKSILNLEFVTQCLEHCFETVLKEESEEIILEISKTWKILLKKCSPEILIKIMFKSISGWVNKLLNAELLVKSVLNSQTNIQIDNNLTNKNLKRKKQKKYDDFTEFEKLNKDLNKSNEQQYDEYFFKIITICEMLGVLCYYCAKIELFLQKFNPFFIKLLSSNSAIQKIIILNILYNLLLTQKENLDQDTKQTTNQKKPLLCTEIFQKLINFYSLSEKNFNCVELHNNNNENNVNQGNNNQNYYPSKHQLYLIIIITSSSVLTVDYSNNYTNQRQDLNRIINIFFFGLQECKIKIFSNQIGNSICHLITRCIEENLLNINQNVWKKLFSALSCNPKNVPNSNFQFKDSLITLEQNLEKSCKNKTQIELNKLERLQNSTSNCLTNLIKNFLKDKILISFQPLSNELNNLLTGTINKDNSQNLINQIYLFKFLIPLLDKKLYNEEIIKKNYFSLFNHLKNSNSSIRGITSLTIATCCKNCGYFYIKKMIKNVIPLLSNIKSEIRLSVAETLDHFIALMEVEIVPYLILLVIPLLRRMSDLNLIIRKVVANAFGTLVKLMPLEKQTKNPLEMSKRLILQKEKQRLFLTQLLDFKEIPNVKIPFPIPIQLRHYQLEGISWVLFLNKYNLHGILADDMGLGKTVQTLMAIFINRFNILNAGNRKNDIELEDNNQIEIYNSYNSISSNSNQKKILPSIIVCPTTLVSHWADEIDKFFSKLNLKVVEYVGLKDHRRLKFQKYKNNFDILLISYQILKTDLEILKKINFLYCILDEGHVIKNPKTQISKAVKKINCEYRLILSGTPIQNNALELWSLFDFLMPGFLGTEQQFKKKFARPIHALQSTKCTDKLREMGILARQQLHQQVLPFVLRRVKEDVLSDLPPKIIQDYYCNFTPLQQFLYVQYLKSNTNVNLNNTSGDFLKVEKNELRNINNSNFSKKKEQFFTRIQYLRKLCIHPKLVINSNYHLNDRDLINNWIKKNKINLKDYRQSCKLVSFMQLLNECGIGLDSDSNKESLLTKEFNKISIASQHKVLAFGQSLTTLDCIQDFLQEMMPNVKFLRIDGNCPPQDRVKVGNRFNRTPEIKLLLLSTHVGGVGLNLTGADTVVFLEHDWNPMKDKQAMDRAHRLGTTKCVNVYRIITKNTIEERIMGLQQFKLELAKAVISGEGDNLEETQVLDLFTQETDNNQTVEQDFEEKRNLEYQEQFNLESFQNKFKN